MNKTINELKAEFDEREFKRRMVDAAMGILDNLRDIADELMILNANFELLNHIKRDNDMNAAKAAGSRSGRGTSSC